MKPTSLTHGEKTAEPFDAVIVSDFEGPRARCFELRTLLFLGAWIEYSGRARAFPVSVACIGEPPRSVRWLAERAGAFLSVHAPLPLKASGMANKLRAFEIQGRSRFLFLLDADQVVLRDPSGLAAGGAELMLAPASVPRVPERCWRRIYAALNLDAPDAPWPCLIQEGSWGCAPDTTIRDEEGQPHSCRPYFNGGGVFVSWAHAQRLRELWQAQMVLIDEALPEEIPHWIGKSADDQAGLSTAAVTLMRSGIPFARLPDAYNVRWQHLYLRSFPFRDIRFFHAMRLARHPVDAQKSLPASLFLYPAALWESILRLAIRERRKKGRLASIPRAILPALWDAWRVTARMRTVYWRHIRPALRA